MASTSGGGHSGKRRNSGRKRIFGTPKRAMKECLKFHIRVYFEGIISHSWHEVKFIAGYAETCSDSVFAAHFLSLEHFSRHEKVNGVIGERGLYLFSIIPFEDTVSHFVNQYSYIYRNELPASCIAEVLFIIFLGTYYTVAIFEIGLAIAATCIVLNFYYRKTKMPSWIKTVLLKTLAPVVRVKMKTRIFPVRESQRSTDAAHANDVIHNPTFETFNLSDGGLGWGGITDVFEQSQNVAITSVNLRKDSLSFNEEEDEHADNPAKKMNGVSIRRNPSQRGEKTSSKKTTVDNKEPPSIQQRIQWQDEWRAASQVLDRLIIGFSIIIGCVSAAVIFLQAPRVRKLFTIS